VILTPQVLCCAQTRCELLCFFFGCRRVCVCVGTFASFHRPACTHLQTPAVDVLFFTSPLRSVAFIVFLTVSLFLPLIACIFFFSFELCCFEHAPPRSSSPSCTVNCVARTPPLSLSIPLRTHSTQGAIHSLFLFCTLWSPPNPPPHFSLSTSAVH
jgi:hypothetical protein